MVLQSFKFVNNIFYRFDLRCSNAKTFVEIKIIKKLVSKNIIYFNGDWGLGQSPIPNVGSGPPPTPGLKYTYKYIKLCRRRRKFI